MVGEVEVLGHAPGLEPQRDRRAAHEQPVAVQSVDEGLHDGVEARAVERVGHPVHTTPVADRGANGGVDPDAWDGHAGTSLASAVDGSGEACGRALLERAGVPIGAARPPARRWPPEAEVRDAFLAAIAAGLDDPTPHAAWAAAFAHHWPSRFGALFGPAGPALLAGLRARVDDRNRFLKLRRIAIANLAARG